MKKSVILILIAVYVISIAVVGFFGLNVKFYQPNIPPEKIEINQVTYLGTTLDCTTNSKGEKNVVIDCYEDQLSVALRYTVTPDNATDKSVRYSFDPGNYVTEKDGLIVFTRPEDNMPIFIKVKVYLAENNTIYDEVIVAIFFY